MEEETRDSRISRKLRRFGRAEDLLSVAATGRTATNFLALSVWPGYIAARADCARGGILRSLATIRRIPRDCGRREGQLTLQRET